VQGEKRLPENGLPIFASSHKTEKHQQLHVGAFHFLSRFISSSGFARGDRPRRLTFTAVIAAFPSSALSCILAAILQALPRQAERRFRTVVTRHNRRKMNRGRNGNNNGAVDGAVTPPAAVQPRRSTESMFNIQADGSVHRVENSRPIQRHVRMSHLQAEAAVQQWADHYNRLSPRERASRANYARATAELNQILAAARHDQRNGTTGPMAVPPSRNPLGAFIELLIPSFFIGFVNYFISSILGWIPARVGMAVASTLAPAAAPNGVDAKMAVWMNRIRDAAEGPFPLSVGEIAQLTELAIGALRDDNLYLELVAPISQSKKNLHGDFANMRHIIDSGNVESVRACICACDALELLST
jgi:hypothetical protein